MVDVKFGIRKDYFIHLFREGVLKSVIVSELQKFLSEKEEKYNFYIHTVDWKNEDVIFHFVALPSKENGITLEALDKIINRIVITDLPDGSIKIEYKNDDVFCPYKTISEEEIKLYILKALGNIQEKDENFLHNYFDNKAREEEKKKLLKKETGYEYDEKELMK